MDVPLAGRHQLYAVSGTFHMWNLVFYLSCTCIIYAAVSAWEAVIMKMNGHIIYNSGKVNKAIPFI